MITLQSCRDFCRYTMGLCLGCCPRDSDNESIGPDGDRARLINGEVLPNDSTHFRDSDEENDDFPYGSLGGENNRHVGKNQYFQFFFHIFSVLTSFSLNLNFSRQIKSLFIFSVLTRFFVVNFLFLFFTPLF